MDLKEEIQKYRLLLEDEQNSQEYICAHCGGDMRRNTRCSNDGLCVSIADFDDNKEVDNDQPETTTQKNWWGETPHPSDELVHWRQRTHNPEFKKNIVELRAAWDLIHSNPKLAAAADLIAEWQRDLASAEQGELDAGEDL